MSMITAQEQAAIDLLAQRGETIYVTDENHATRAITAIVIYEQDAHQAVPGMRTRTPKCLIKVLDDILQGIVPDCEWSKLTLTMSPRRNSNKRTFKIARIAHQGPGLITYEVS